jgi:heme iron utilization protein
MTTIVTETAAASNPEPSSNTRTDEQAARPDPHRRGGFDPQPDVARLSHAVRARTLVAGSGRATLCTVALDPAGYPFGSIVTYLADHAGRPWVLISTMAEHTRNASSDPRATVLVAEVAPPDIDPLALARVSLIGDLLRAEPTPQFRAQFLDRHPGARNYVDFPDFSWWRLDVRALRYVGGFGQMSWVGVDDYGAAAPDRIAPHAAGIVAHMNADHSDASVTLLRHFLGRPDIVSAHMTAVDELGCDFDTVGDNGRLPLRLPFSSPVPDQTGVREMLVSMLNDARGARP